MITSNRRFGVEIEFVAPNATMFERVRRQIPVIRDGSLDPLQHAGEWVSEPLRGDSGERNIHAVCEVLKKHGATGDNPKTSIHVHLDGRVGQGVLKTSRSPVPGVNQIAISNRLKASVGSINAMSLLNGNGMEQHIDRSYSVSDFEGIQYFSLAQLTGKPRINYTYYYLDKPDRFIWLRNVFYFYTKFSETMEALVSDSRKFGNMYCVPLGKSYNLDDIQLTQNMNDLRGLWYKGRRSAGHYDDSRYHNVNLHCFWDRHGTVEIRSHGGTIDPNKILLWVKLHQCIVDKLEEVSLEELVAMEGTPQGFINFLGDGMLEDYTKRLLGFYSGIKVK